MPGLHHTIIWLVTALVSLGASLAQGWTDPELEMYGNRPEAPGQILGECDCHCGNENGHVDLDKINKKGIIQPLFLNEMKILIGNWMYLAGMHNFHLPAGEERSVPLTMTLSDLDLKSINKFLREATANNLIDALKALKNSLSTNNVFKQESFNLGDGKTLIESKEKWIKIIFNIIMSCWNKETMLVVTSLLLGGFFLKAMFFGADFRVLFSMFIVAVFFAGFLWNWCYMYQKAVVDQHVKRLKYEKYASSCKPDDSFWGFVKNLFGYSATLDECTEYFRGVEIDPLIMVAPTLALSETITMFIIHPLELMADLVQRVTRLLFGNMVGGMYYGTPLVLIIFSGLFLMFFILITGRRLKFKIAYLGSFEVGSQFEYFHRPALVRDDRPMIKNSIEDSSSRVRESIQQRVPPPSDREDTASMPPSSSAAPENLRDYNSSASRDANPGSSRGNSCNAAPFTSHCCNTAQVGHYCNAASAGHFCNATPQHIHACMPSASGHTQSRSVWNSESLNFPLSPSSINRLGNSLRQRKSPLVDVTNGRNVTRDWTNQNERQFSREWTNQNVRGMTKEWTDENRREVEDILYVRRRKLSY